MKTERDRTGHEAHTRGFTLVELLVVVLIIALLIAIMLPSISKARQVSRRMTCASQMRQIGLGLFQYEKDSRCMPNAQWNALQMLMPYFGLSNAHMVVGPGKCGPKVSRYSEIFKCPSNSYIRQKDMGHALSYTPIVDSGYLDGDDDGERDGNFLYCAWSYCRTGFDRDDDGAAQEVDFVWQMRDLGCSAPDTALFVEYWSPTNRIQFKKPTPPAVPGYMRVDWGTGTVMGTVNWSGGPVDQSGPLTDVADVGGHVYLSAFAYEAHETDHEAPLGKVCHDGTINLLLSDGAVIAYSLKDITRESPRDIPIWTRQAD